MPHIAGCIFVVTIAEATDLPWGHFCVKSNGDFYQEIPRILTTKVVLFGESLLGKRAFYENIFVSASFLND